MKSAPGGGRRKALAVEVMIEAHACAGNVVVCSTEGQFELCGTPGIAFLLKLFNYREK